LIYHDIVTKSPLTAMFAHARVIKKIACMATAYSSMKIPCRGNILVIGDAAAYVEVETQGHSPAAIVLAALLCQELSGMDGFAEYTRWCRSLLNLTVMITFRWPRVCARPNIYR